jgi:hypothetical protein
MNNLPIVVMENKANGMQAIKLTEEPFEGIIYTYGKVEFKEDEGKDKINLAFEYEILDMNNKGLTDMKPFEIYIGKILEELIHIGIEENNISYTGGVDENRTENSEQFDT